MGQKETASKRQWVKMSLSSASVRWAIMLAASMNGFVAGYRSTRRCDRSWLGRGRQLPATKVDEPVGDNTELIDNR